MDRDDDDEEFDDAKEEEEYDQRNFQLSSYMVSNAPNDRSRRLTARKSSKHDRDGIRETEKSRDTEGHL